MLSASPDLPRVLGKIVAGRAAAEMEDQHLDFKIEKPSLKETFQDLTEAAICFANGDGGVLVVGVHDRPGGPSALAGTQIDPETLRGRIYELSNPALLVEVQVLTHDGVRLLVVRVPSGIDVHGTQRGHATHRVHRSCMPMSPADIARLTEERRGTDWSETSSARPIADADPEAMRVVRRLLVDRGDDRSLRMARSSDAELLRSMQLVAPDGALTRAGELLVCTAAGQAADEILVYQHRRTASGEADAAERWGTPVITAFVGCMGAVVARQASTPVTFLDGQQVAVQDYPSEAVREALANALVHGDYRDRRPTTVEHSSQVLRVASPGPLVTGVTPQNILTKGSKARFPLLAKAFRRLGLAEELGQGVDRMFREMASTGRAVPTIVDAGSEVVVTFSGQAPNVRVARFLRGLPEAERQDTDTLLILGALCRRRTVTAEDVAALIQRDMDAADSVLRRLSAGEAALLEPTAGTVNRRFPQYRLVGAVLVSLGSAVTYHRRATTEIDSKVIDHVRDYGDINNRTLQRLFDIDVYKARDLLRDLVGRELLTRVSSQTRGTAVRYGPGPRFPGRPKKKR